MTRPRGKLFTVRMAPAIQIDFHAVAKLRGATMSGLVHQYAVRLIREEKERDMAAFEEMRREVLKETKHTLPATPVLHFEKRTSSSKLKPKAKKRSNER